MLMVRSHHEKCDGGMPSLIPNDKRGFTIVELMIATIVFSVIMLVASGAVVRFTTNFQKGLTQTTTQNTARSVIENISQSLQFAGASGAAPLNPANGSRGYCVNSTNYSFIKGVQLEDQAHHVLVERPGSGVSCGGSAQDVLASPEGQELLSPHMRLSRLDIQQQGSKLYTLTIKVVYGDDDLLCIAGETNTASPRHCNSTLPLTNVASLSDEDLAKLQCKTQKGSEYCAVSELTTTVQSRL